MRGVYFLLLAFSAGACRPSKAKNVDEDPGRFIQTWDVVHDTDSVCKIDYGFTAEASEDSGLGDPIAIPKDTFPEDGVCKTGPYNAVYSGDLKLPNGAAKLLYPVFLKFTKGKGDELFDPSYLAGNSVKFEFKFFYDRPIDHLYVLVIENPGIDEVRTLLDKQSLEYTQIPNEFTHVKFPIKHSYAVYAPFEYKEPIPSGFP